MIANKNLFIVPFVLCSAVVSAQTRAALSRPVFIYNTDSVTVHKMVSDTLIVLKDTCAEDRIYSEKALAIGKSEAEKRSLPIQIKSHDVNQAVRDLDISAPVDKVNTAQEAMSQYKSEVSGLNSQVENLKSPDVGIPDNPEALSHTAENEALRTDEFKELQKERVSAKELDKYRQAIEQYKDEKRIRQELKEKGRDLANDAIQKQQGKVDVAMKKVKSANRKFDYVQDIRNLPTRVPNPMKGLSWRERLVPGVTFQFFENSLTWLEFDPQLYYKISGNWSAGLGGTYRFSLDKRHFEFDHFDNLFGVKAFAQCHVFKGFFILSEGQLVSWKTWTQSTADPSYRNKTYVALVGIGKQYSLTSRIKGNVQTLYQFHEGADPYKSRIIFRLGFDFSLRKKEVRDWEKNLRNRVKSANSIKR